MHRAWRKRLHLRRQSAEVKSTSEAAFETAIESVLLRDGYRRVAAKGFDRERAIFPDEALVFIQAAQAKVWEKLEALHGE